MSAWYHAVTAIRNEIMGWTMRQSKHATVGWPLVTLLTCLQDDQRFMGNNEQLIEALLSRLKVDTSASPACTGLYKDPISCQVCLSFTNSPP